MPRTPDRRAGGLDEEEIFLEDRTADGDPTDIGAIRRIGDDVRLRTSTGIVSLVSGSGLSAGSHRALDQLVHNIAETSYLEVTRDGGGKTTDVIVWTDNGKTTKIREVNITRTSGKVSSVVVKQYDGSGTLAETLTGTITRSSGKVASIEWVLS